MRNAEFLPDASAARLIAADVASYNSERLGVHQTVRKRVPLFVGGFLVVVLALVLFAIYGMRAGDAKNYTLATLIVGGIIVGFMIYGFAVSPATKLQQGFRDRLIPSAFGFIKDVSYRNGGAPPSLAHLPRAAVGTFNRTTIDDTVTGVHDGFPFELYEAHLSYKQGKSTTVVFKGIILAFSMPKSFPGTIVATKSVGAASRVFRDLFGKGGLYQVETGDPTFDAAYEFRSDNPDAARPLVTGSFPRALDLLKEAWADPNTRVALTGTNAYLLLPSTKNFFELPAVSVDCDYKSHVEPMVADVAALLATASLVRRIA